MKIFYALVFVICATNAFGQSPVNNKTGDSIPSKNKFENDSSLKVVYADKESSVTKVAYFINQKLANKTLLETLSPSLIDSVHLVRESIEVDGTKYQAQMYLTTKNTYKPKLISLQALKDKYTNLKYKPVIFMIDGIIVSGDYNTYLIDESCLFMIMVDNIATTKEKTGLGFIKLLNKVDRNQINDKENIRIRGTDLGMAN